MVNPIFSIVAVEQLRKNSWNTNQVSPDNEAKIRVSIERNGIFKPILVRQVEGQDGYEIIGGEHRWEQAISLGYKDVPICNLGKITELQAKEIGIIDNARYGADDTLGLAGLLKEIGTPGFLQEFLPYGDTDLDAIFSSSNIALDTLEFDENFERDIDIVDEPLPARVAKTHNIMRFKVSLVDAERITALIATTQKNSGLTEADELTNAGDALVELLLSEDA